MYSLYFIKENNSSEFYGNGDMCYIMELLNDHCETSNMYGKTEVQFKIVRNF